MLELSEFPKDNVDLLVTDVSSIAFKYSLYFERPSIFTFMGFTKIEFPKDKFYTLLESIGICVYSLKELCEVIANFDEISRQKSLKIKEFLEGEII
ncbi:hypothetical protein B6S12_05780 [Helicobacter valdiviensis]|uniref:Uncharacterized protein n=1 Tax=Helicobacter valdiviensis TaxID=1458358 RepID=A0A2W6MUC1_9HELI|nr:CDP-glycerol glycerophosphotransferase family protein [Helicobacter valdiviensis]PZT48057.1 hypothetical protein B6S12_05780 [Helicobacter valdiviensis]